MRNKRIPRYGLYFILLLAFFVLLRFPYGELKRYAIGEIGRKAGLVVEFSDSGFVLPLGIELDDARFSSTRGKNSFAGPRMENIQFRINPFSFISKKRAVNFRITNGGKAIGRIDFSDEGASFEIESNGIRIGELTLANGINVEDGTLAIESTFRIPGGNYLKGEGDIVISLQNLALQNVNPFMDKLRIGSVRVDAEKKEQDILLKSVSAEVEGLILTGEGKIILKKDVSQSFIKFSGRIDTEKGNEGSLKELVPLLTGLAGGSNNLMVDISGKLEKPAVSINGKKLI